MSDNCRRGIIHLTLEALRKAFVVRRDKRAERPRIYRRSSGAKSFESLERVNCPEASL